MSREISLKCLVCENDFLTRDKNRKYCSRECFQTTRRKSESEKKHYIPAKPRMINCLYCGKEFQLRTNDKYCHDCRHTAYWKTQRYKEAHNRFAKDWQRSHKDKTKAHSLVKVHPELINILYECPCKATSKQLHHPDYSKPYDVLKLCNVCHRSEHKRLRSLADTSAVDNDPIASYQESVPCAGVDGQTVMGTVGVSPT